MAERETAIRAFLEANGWGAARRVPLADDASFRRYDRLTLNGRSAVLMDAPPAQEDVRPFVRVDRLLVGLGPSAPRTLAVDADAGLLLLEDFGDRTYTRALAEGDPEAPLYRVAVDLLIALHGRFGPGAGEVSGLPPYDDERLLGEALLLPDWYYEEVAGAPLPAEDRTAYVEAWRRVLPTARAVPETLVLRDYHVDNLMVLPERQGIAACGLLDFQDAVLGPATYDLVSLLQDARRDVPEDLAAAEIAHYLAARPGLDPAAFEASYRVLGAQRSAKIIGIFTRLWRRDGKPVYLPHIARVWRILEADLAHDALAPVRDWFDRAVPPALRRVPEIGAAP